jgi:hypothetical protein
MARVAPLLLLAAALHAQSIEGTVTNSITRAPIPGVNIRLKGPETYTATTDGGGVFRITQAAPGDYTLEVSVGDFFPSPGTRKPVHVADAPVRVAYELTPLCNLRGRVVFTDGTPARYARVMLAFRRGGSGQWTSADEQGRFSFPRLFPSRYFVLATAPANAKARDGEDWAPTFFPDSTDRAGAQLLTLRSGDDLSGYEIRLRSVPVRRVRGIVRDPLGRPAAGAAVQLAAVEVPASDRKTTSDAEGVFEFDKVRAGDWRLVAGGAPNLKGVEPLTVSGRDLDRVEIRLARPFTVEGFVDREDPVDAEGKRLVSGVSLLPEPSRPELQVLKFHEQDGSFVLKNVYPGRYEIAPLGFKPGFYLESVKLGDREVLGQRVDLFEGVPPIRVTYKPNAPVVRAHVENGAGARVVLVPQDDAFKTDQFIRSQAVGADGRCEIGSLRPGDYFAFAFDRYDIAALEDPMFVRGLVPRAEKVHVEKGETATVSLKVTPWPE